MKCIALVTSTMMIAGLAACGSLDDLVLRPSETIRLTPADFGFDTDAVALPTREDGQVSIWHVRTPSDRKGTLVIVPGNDANKSRYTPGIPIFVNDGWDVILMDYEGFGQSTGIASFDGLFESTRTVFEYAMAQDDVVVGYGISLGTAVLARVAADIDLAACVFESTTNVWESPTLFAERHGFNSPLMMVANAVASLGSTPDFDIKHWITLVQEPKLFLHSPDDNVTPFEGAWDVYELAPQPKHMFVTQGEHATQLFLDPVLYRDVVNGWLDGVLGQDPVLTAEFDAILQDEVQAALANFRVGLGG